MEKLSSLYASALFDLALERNAAGELYDQAVFLREALQDEQCMRVIVHPHITAAEKQELFKTALDGQICDDLLGFLFLATEKNREVCIVPALSGLIEMLERHMNKTTAKVTSATDLDDSQIEEMKEVLSEKLDKTVEVSINVDSSIIGGPYIFVDGYYIDWTIRTRLRDLTVHMKEGCGV